MYFFLSKKGASKRASYVAVSVSENAILSLSIIILLLRFLTVVGAERAVLELFCVYKIIINRGDDYNIKLNTYFCFVMH